MKKDDTMIIADCSSNHMGNMDIAFEMIQVAADAGVDTVKFQSWRADKIPENFPDYDSVYARHSKTQLSDDDHFRLIEYCNQCNINFLTTCFDIDRVDFLASLGLSTIKVASPDCASFNLLDLLMKKFSRLIISTGMSTDKEIESMINHVKGHDVVVLHCVSIYPTPLEKVNLERIEWLKSFGVKVGFSDHSLGTEASMLAISMGVEIIEKHFTLSMNLPGKDQSMSTEIHEFKEIVNWRDKVKIMRGLRNPPLTEGEMALRDIYIGKWGDNK